MLGLPATRVALVTLCRVDALAALFYMEMGW